MAPHHTSTRWSHGPPDSLSIALVLLLTLSLVTTLQDPAPRTPARANTPAPKPVDPPEPPRFSFVQILASALAAVTSTIALSYFGVAGTIIGAGVASALTVVGNVVYTRSIMRAQRLAAVPVKMVVKGGTGTQPAAKDGRVVSTGSTSVAGQDSTSVAGQDSTCVAGQDSTSVAGQDSTSVIETQVEPVETVVAPPRWWTRKRIVVATLSLFGIVLVGITSIELFLGKPISDALRGQDGSGSSISHVISGSSARTPASTDVNPADPGTTTDDAPAGDGTDTSGTTGDDSESGSDSSDDGTTGGTTIDPDTDGSGSDSDSDSDESGTGTDPDAGTDGGSGTDTDSGTDPDDGTDSGTDTGTDGGTDPDAEGTDPDPGTNTSSPGSDAPTDSTVSPSTSAATSSDMVSFAQNS